MLILQAAFSFSKSLFKMLLLTLVLVIILSRFIHAHLADCVDGALAYHGCTFNGVDVSAEVTMLGWASIVIFAACVCSGVLALLLWPFGPIKESPNNSLKSGTPENGAP